MMAFSDELALERLRELRRLGEPDREALRRLGDPIHAMWDFLDLRYPFSFDAKDDDAVIFDCNGEWFANIGEHDDGPAVVAGLNEFVERFR